MDEDERMLNLNRIDNKILESDRNKLKSRDLLSFQIQRLKNIEKSVSVTKKNTSQLETQTSIILKHEMMLKEAVKESALQVKFDSLRNEIFKHVNQKLEEMNTNVTKLLSTKVEHSIFYE